MAILSLSVSNISGKQRRQVIDDRRRKYNAVKPVKDSSVARDQPVSYTHLDVYKRQTVKGSIYTRSAMSLSVMMVAGFEFRSTTSSPSSFKERQADVYKRQGRSAKSRPESGRLGWAWGGEISIHG